MPEPTSEQASTPAQPAATPTRSPKVAFFAGGDPLEIKLWSGTPYYALSALREVCDVSYVERRPFPRFLHPLARLILRLSGGRIDIRMLRWVIRLASAPARRRLRKSDADVYVSAASSGLAGMLGKDTQQILISDATSTALTRYYPEMQYLWPWVRGGFSAMERAAMEQARWLTYPSNWAAASASEDFGTDPAKIAVLPWGPNMAKPAAPQVRTLTDGPLKLLFVGIAWDRKGGEIALETARLLAERGTECTLDIVGVDASSARGPVPDNVRFHGRLDKGDPEETTQLEALFAGAHLFVLPTRAEALGMVFAEAAAMALPSVSYATGGVETVVKHGETGLLLSPDAGAEDFANTIAALANDPARYQALSAAALRDSEERLDWSVWAKAMKHLIEDAAS